MGITIQDIEDLAGTTFSPPLPGDTIVNISHNIKKAKKEDVVFLPFNEHKSHIYSYLDKKKVLDVKAVISDSNYNLIEKFNKPMLIVENAYLLYKQLAKLARSRYKGDLVMIIGSAGKTAMKIYINQLVSSRLRCNILADSKNQTRSICQTVCDLNEQVDLCVIEAATASPSSVEKRSDIIRPNIILATEILEEHMKYHSDIESLIKTKLKSLDFIQGKRIFIHQFQENLSYTFTEAINNADLNKVYTYGWSSNCDAYIKSISLNPSGQSVRSNIMGVDLNYEIPFIEKFAALQITATLLVCKILGLNINDMIDKTNKLKNYESSGNMYELERKADKKRILMYSSCDRGSFPSFLGLLDTITSTKKIYKGRKIGIFSKMIDSNYNGKYEFNNSNAIDLLNDTGLDLLITLWDFSKVHNTQSIKIPMIHFDTLDSLKTNIMELIQDGDVIFMKATWTKEESLKTLRDYLLSVFESNSLLY